MDDRSAEWNLRKLMVNVYRFLSSETRTPEKVIALERGLAKAAQEAGVLEVAVELGREGGGA